MTQDKTPIVLLAQFIRKYNLERHFCIMSV